ncbi:neuronal acetylcholine receptor subunit alpha-3-like [Branchiostoma floridae]|uniref:Neuronal acetylcholine receptor subunit alpha-3-like n=1 Tax=Branchiostoma floridae TaxID=7739 RepID=A0A9J7MJB8_BRAFL|nr:neuronal acetylcholine receptor subunit alpha-3-like [Branchiostoma floridae]
MRLCRFLVILVAIVKVNGGSFSENHLVDRLLSGYNTDARPVKNSSSPVTVAIDIALAQLINVNDRQQDIMVNIWMRQYWTDEFLSWNPDDYYGLDVVRIQSSAIWRPDIVIYNGIFAEGYAELPDTKVTITSDGSVTYLYPFTFKAACKINVEDFPYDTQTCPLKFGSWSYDGLAIDVVNKSSHGDLEFEHNGIWTVIDLPAQRNVVTYPASEVPYPDVTFHVVIQRQSLFYVFFIFFPSVLIVFISLISFMLPPETGEKLSLSITMLLSLVVYMQLVNTTLPTTSRYIPLVGRFFGATIIIVAMTTMLSIFVISLHFSNPNPKPPPSWLKRMMGMSQEVFVMEWLFCGCGRRASHSFAKEELQTGRQHHRKKSNKDIVLLSMRSAIEKSISTVCRERSFSQSRSTSDFLTNRLLVKLDDIICKMNRVKEERGLEEQKQDVLSEWNEVAARMDRVFLLIFVVVAVAACTTTSML